MEGVPCPAADKCSAQDVSPPPTFRVPSVLVHTKTRKWLCGIICGSLSELLSPLPRALITFCSIRTSAGLALPPLRDDCGISWANKRGLFAHPDPTQSLPFEGQQLWRKCWFLPDIYFFDKTGRCSRREKKKIPPLSVFREEKRICLPGAACCKGMRVQKAR